MSKSKVVAGYVAMFVALALAGVPWLAFLSFPVGGLVGVAVGAMIGTLAAVVSAPGEDPMTARSHAGLLARRGLTAAAVSASLAAAIQAVLTLVVGAHWWPALALSAGVALGARGARVFLANRYPHPGIDYE